MLCRELCRVLAAFTHRGLRLLGHPTPRILISCPFQGIQGVGTSHSKRRIPNTLLYVLLGICACFYAEGGTIVNLANPI